MNPGEPGDDDSANATSAGVEPEAARTRLVDARLDSVSCAARIRVGHALDPETQLGPLVTAAHRDRVLGHIEAAKADGAAVLLGGEPLALGGELARGNFVPATILADPDGSSRISREEVFGPVALVERWGDEDDAVARANATA